MQFSTRVAAPAQSEKCMLVSVKYGMMGVLQNDKEGNHNLF
jgi:hypothetical protein